MTSTDYEKLGSFYLGRPDGGESAGPLLYDSRDLVTHDGGGIPRPHRARAA